MCINNVNYNPKTIQYGVPQASILGPLLFLIFMNDISQCTNQFKYILHADDSTLSTCVPDDNVVNSVELINSELKCLEQWLMSNKISINADKTKFILFSCNKNIHFPLFKIGNNTIGEASVTLFGGIHLDKRLNFKNNIAQLQGAAA